MRTHVTSSTIELPETKRQAWQHASEQVEISNGQDLYQTLLSEAAELGQEHFPEHTKKRVENMAQGHEPFLLLRNMPIDSHLPDSPTNGQRPKQKSTWVSEISLLATAAGGNLQPLSYRQEKGDALIHEVAPSIGKEKTLSNGGRVPLGFHTDDSILKRHYRPEYLMLLGLINQNQTPTYIARLDDALQELDERHKQILREPHFRVETPQSFNLWGGKIIQSELRPLVSKGPQGKDEIAGNLYAVKTEDKEAQAALHAISNILPQVAIPIVLQPGTLLIFNNHRCLHARAAVTGKRWLQRIFCRTELTSLRRATRTNSNCHIFDIHHIVLE